MSKEMELDNEEQALFNALSTCGVEAKFDDIHRDTLVLDFPNGERFEMWIEDNGLQSRLQVLQEKII